MDDRHWHLDPMSNDPPTPEGTPVRPDPPPAPSQPQRRRIGVVANIALSAIVGAASAFGVLAVARTDTTTAPATIGSAPSVVQAATQLTVDELDLIDVIAEARQPVVTITSEVETRMRGPWGRSTMGTGVGSGVIISSDGYILTNRHVIEDASSISVELADGTIYAADVVDVSDADDLALIKVDGSGLPSATIGNSDDIEVGETALAIGSPLGEYTDTVTKGIISALGRDIEVADASSRSYVELTDLIQTDAAINQGNSGGPLLNAAGEVIGINTAMATSAENLGFATPINAAASLLATAGVSVTG